MKAYKLDFSTGQDYSPATAVHQTARTSRHEHFRRLDRKIGSMEQEKRWLDSDVAKECQFRKEESLPLQEKHVPGVTFGRNMKAPSIYLPHLLAPTPISETLPKHQHRPFAFAELMGSMDLPITRPVDSHFPTGCNGFVLWKGPAQGLWLDTSCMKLDAWSQSLGLVPAKDALHFIALQARPIAYCPLPTAHRED